MKNLYIILILILSGQFALAQNTDSPFDDNTAFYEGKTFNYIIAPPDGFQMNSVEATDDGYSFAFISKDEMYAEATLIIGINIFKIKDTKDKSFTLEKLINDDTTAIRTHYGKDIKINEVKAIHTATTDSLRTIYFNSSDNVLANVMMSYFNGKSEILIFDLTITDAIPRFQAEKIYLECLNQIKILTTGKIDVG